MVSDYLMRQAGLPINFCLQYLQVSTNYDLKEKISRNYAFALGSTSEPVLIYKITSGAAVSNISVLWLDPTQTLVDVGEISLDEISDVSTDTF